MRINNINTDYDMYKQAKKFVLGPPMMWGSDYERYEMSKVQSDGSTASYYELPKGCTELQDLIAYRNMNAQIGEIFRACFRYGIVSHSDRLRDAKKMKFYAQAEIERLEKYGKSER